MNMNQRTKKSIRRFIRTNLALIGLVEGIDYLYRSRYPYQIRPFKETTLVDKCNTMDGLEDYRIQIEWIKEKSYSRQMKETVWPFLEANCQEGRLPRHGYELSYAIYSLPHPRARLVIVHGLNEFKEKYAEMIYYLLQAGISVYTYDSRGHGNSKLSETDQEIDLSDFEIMIKDLHDLVLHWQLDQEPFSLYGHSMGGGVATAYSQTYPKFISNLILSSPMIGVFTHGIKRSSTHLLAEFACRMGRGHRGVPKKGNYYQQRAMFYHPNNVCNNSNVRGYYAFRLNHLLHAYPTFGPTMNWLRASIILDNQINQCHRIKAMDFPVTIFKAECDRLVDNRAIDHLASFLPQGQIVLVEDSKHEIFTHHDNIVFSYMSIIIHEILEAQNNEFDSSPM